MTQEQEAQKFANDLLKDVPESIVNRDAGVMPACEGMKVTFVLPESYQSMNRSFNGNAFNAFTTKEGVEISWKHIARRGNGLPLEGGYLDRIKGLIQLIYLNGGEYPVVIASDFTRETIFGKTHYLSFRPLVEIEAEQTTEQTAQPRRNNRRRNNNQAEQATEGA